MTAPERPPRRALRWVLVAACSLAALLLAAVIVAPMFIPWEKIKAEAEAKVSQALGREVRIGAVGFNLFRGIEIRKLTVANAPGFSDQPLLTDESAILHYRLLPLLWGQVAVKALVLDRPVLLIEKSADGRFNFSGPRRPEPSPAPAAPAAEDAPKGKAGASQLPLDFLVSRLAIQGATLTYRDLKTRKTYELDDFNLELRQLSLTGLAPTTLAIQARLRAPGTSLPIKADARWRLQWPQEALALEEVKIALPGVSFQARGKVERLAASPVVDVTGDLALEFAPALAALGPLAGPGKTGALRLSGGGAVRFKVAGPVREPGALVISVDDRIQAQVAAAGLQVPVRLEGTLNLARADLKCAQALTVPGLSAELTAGIADCFQARTVTAKLTAKLDLAETAAKLVPPAQAAKLAEFKARGRAELTAVLSGPASAPKRMDLSAQCRAEDVSLAYGGKTLVEDLTGTLAALPDRVSVPGLQAKLGGQPVKLVFLAQGFDLREPASLKPDALKAKIDWSLNSPLLDLDALLALAPAKPSESATAAAGTAAAPAASSPAAPATVSDLPEPDARKLLPPGLTMRGTAALGGMKFGAVRLGKMDFRLEIAKQVVTETGQVAGYQGTIQEKARLDFSQSLLGYTVEAETRNVDLEPLLNDVVDTFAAAKLKKPRILSEIKGKLTGRLSGKLRIAGAGMRTAAAKPRLTGQGVFTLLDGRIRQFAFQEALARLFGSERFKQDIPFDHTAVEFTLADQEVNLAKFTAESGPQGLSGDIRMAASGRIGFNAEFRKFGLRPSLNPRVSTRLAPEFGQYAEILKDDRGWVTIPVAMNGPLAKPDVQPDWDWIKQQFGGYVRKKTQAAADEAGKKIQNFISNQQGKSADQVKDDLGSEINKAKDQLQNLKNLFH